MSPDAATSVEAIIRQEASGWSPEYPRRYVEGDGLGSNAIGTDPAVIGGWSREHRP